MTLLLSEVLERLQLTVSRQGDCFWEDVEILLAAWRAQREALESVADDTEFSCMPTDLQERVLELVGAREADAMMKAREV